MASSSSPARRGNLLLTLPPELRNAIYALVITTDFYELDPTISAKTFPRPRYHIFMVQRGIKAQGGTPAIAQTCRQIRTEALDVYYGSNTFALVGDDSTQAKHNAALTNRIAAHEWMQLIGNDAKYLRKVRFLVRSTKDWVFNILVSVLPDPNGDAPVVTATAEISSEKPLPAATLSSLQTAIPAYLAKTGDMGRIWRNVVERALYIATFDRQGHFDLDISDEGIAKAKAAFPFKMPKASPRKHTSSNVYQMPSTQPARTLKQPVQHKQAKISKRAVQPSYDSDGMEVEAPAKKVQTLNTSPAAAKQQAQFDRNQAEDSDLMEIGAPAKKKKTAKKARQSKGARGTEQMTTGVPKVAPKAALEVGNDKIVDETNFEAPAKKANTAKKAKAGDAELRVATRASTRKRIPRKL